MKRDEIQQQLKNNLEKADIAPEKIIIQKDPYGGWQVAVIAKGFEGISQKERIQVVLAGIKNEELEWVELVTPEEREWIGTLPGDIEVESLPLWPEALARGTLGSTEKTVFPSDLDEDLDPPIVATFYSLRGGVGRSTALAYTAHLLSANRRKVVCVDMDLEAPGLAALFKCEDEVTSSQGVVSLLVELDQGEEPDFASHLIPVPESDNIYLIPAGRTTADYARKLRFIMPDAWYREERNPLKLFLTGIKEKLPFKPDVILLDARTGITDINGPLLFDLADIAIVTFFPHPQARLGTELLTQGLLTSRTGRKISGQALAPEPRFLVSPLPNVPELQKKYEVKSFEWISDWLSGVNEDREDSEILDERELTHFVRYRDEIASSNYILQDSTIWKNFEPVANWIERFLPSENEEQQARSLENEKDNILQNLSFATGTAEAQGYFIESFVETTVVKDAVSTNIPLVLGRKGSGKTAIFRRISESTERGDSVIVHAPAPLKKQRSWIITADGFREIEKVIRESELSWRHFWILYVNIATVRSLDVADYTPEYLKTCSFESELDIISAFEKTAKTSRAPLELNDWLRHLDNSTTADTFLLFDGLDTGFNSASEDRVRRTHAIEGLFDLLMDQGQALQNLHFKILLREDIWKGLHFENKSHLYGRSVVLKWSDKATYLKVALKQALLCKELKQFLKDFSGAPSPDRPVDTWTENDVFFVWNILVGERMKGGKTTFTRNWVWTRLADGNKDHTPRYLLQLFHEAVPWEKNAHARSPYTRALIRPRALIECLSEVSLQALGALKEEFKELEPLLDNLKRIGRTPVAASDLERQSDLIPLALEVGILSVYEEHDDGVSRYRIPDIYRHALRMTRKGQA
ncbi:MAG TPA: ParA family protein [Desulfobulbus sp.]|nr:ParA family protein [Desulfobulbus sp.]